MEILFALVAERLTSIVFVMRRICYD